MKRFFIALAAVVSLPLFSQPTTIFIGVDDCSYNPSSTNISMGDTVVWLWQASNARTITSTIVPPGAPSFNGSVDATHPSYSYIFSVPGDYYYKSSILPTCVAHVNVQTATGIARSTIQYNSKIYPNPVKEALQLIYPHGGYSISIFSLKGELIKNHTLDITQTNAKIPTGDLSPGLYTYTIYNKDGHEMTKSKFIKIP